MPMPLYRVVLSPLALALLPLLFELFEDFDMTTAWMGGGGGVRRETQAFVRAEACPLGI